MREAAEAITAKPTRAINTPEWVRSTISKFSSLMRSASFNWERWCIFPSYNGRVESVEVIVGGGGIIGLSVALELARKGLRVRVLEKGRAMSEASWAAAGMLSAHDPSHPAELAELAELSIRLYPEYLSAVEELSGHQVRIRTHGAVMTGGNRGRLAARSAEEAQRRIPGLSTEGRSYWWMEETSLDPRDLCVA